MFSINPRNVAELLIQQYSNLPKTDLNEREIDLKQHLDEIIETFQNSLENDVVSFSDLEIDPTEDDNEIQSESYKESEESFCPDEPGPSHNSARSSGTVSFKYKEKAVKFWRSEKDGGKRPLSTVKARFKRIKSENILYRWATQVGNGGTFYDKCTSTAKSTLQEFRKAKEKGLIVHDIDLMRWAIEFSKELDVPDFKASPKWVRGFKKENKILSRKVTKTVSRINFQNKDALQAKATAFVDSVKPLIDEFSPDNVYNSDQSGFNLEMHSARTLADKGVKKVEITAQSVNATTHSYTIQALISCSGKLVGPLLIVLPETNGDFGPRVKQNLFLPKNLFVVASKSGKCSTEIMKKWYKEVFLPNTGPKSLLLVDSWGGFKHMADGVETTKKVTMNFMPEGTTGIIQPWDKFGARSWKHYCRRSSDLLNMADSSITLHERNNIIKLQSLTYIQLTSPRYSGLFKYSWYCSGYITERGEKLPNPAQWAFDNLGDAACVACEDIPILQCSWCKDALCAKHFFVAYHNCENFVP